MAEHANALLDELLAFWRCKQRTPPVPAGNDTPAVYDPELSPALRATARVDLGAELGGKLVSEVLQGVRAGRQGIFVSEPERLRTAIFLRGYTLGEFARFAGMAPSTLSRALSGQPVAPSSWQALITALVHA